MAKKLNRLPLLLQRAEVMRIDRAGNMADGELCFIGDDPPFDTYDLRVHMQLPNDGTRNAEHAGVIEPHLVRLHDGHRIPLLYGDEQKRPLGSQIVTVVRLIYMGDPPAAEATHCEKCGKRLGSMEYNGKSAPTSGPLLVCPACYDELKEADA